MLWAWCVVMVGVAVDMAGAEVVYEWKELEYSGAVPGGGGNRSHWCLTGVKVDLQGRFYGTVPRWLPHVPATLVRILPPTNTDDDDGAPPLLDPYPSWNANDLSLHPPLPYSLTYVQSMEIDSRNWMWILDVGRQNIFGPPESIINGPAKLVIWDIDANCMVRRHVFPDSVLPANNSFANDLVIDEANGLAYISDTWANGGIIVYSLSQNSSWRWDHPAFRGDPNGKIRENGVTYSNSSPSDGIALSSDRQWIYFSAVSFPYLYRVPAAQLADPTTPKLTVDFIGIKGYSDGMTFDLEGNLYYGSAEDDALMIWNTSEPFSSRKVFLQDNITMQWVDTLGFDGKSVVWSTNRLLRFFQGNLSDTDPNFRIFRVPIESKSYIFSGSPVPASLPCSN